MALHLVRDAVPLLDAQARVHRDRQLRAQHVPGPPHAHPLGAGVHAVGDQGIPPADDAEQEVAHHKR